MQDKQAKEREKRKDTEKTSAAVLADKVLQKTAFSVTARGHAFDADQAALRKQHALDMARRILARAK